MLELTQKPNVESFIGSNIEALEEILDERAQRYLKLRREKEKFDFGQTLTPEKLRELAGEVIRDTNNFLGISDAPHAYFSMFYLPRILKQGVYVALGVFAVGTLAGLKDGLTTKDLQMAGLLALGFGGGTVSFSYRDHIGSAFDRSEKVMRIAERKTVPAVGAVSHEYTHLLQDKTKLRNQRRNPVVEGHARGVEGVITSLFAQRYNNPAYVFNNAERVAEETKDAYLFVCAQRGITPRQSLANLPIPNVRGFLYRFFGHHYSIGVAAMSIAEAIHGDKIYRDVLRNDFSFLRVK